MKVKNIFYYIKNYKYNSLFVKNFTVIILIVILPLMIISWNIYHKMNDVVQNEISSINYDSLCTVRDIIDNIFSDAEKIAASLSLDTNIDLFFKSSLPEPIIDTQYQKIDTAIRKYMLIYKYIDSIYLYSEKMEYVFSNNVCGSIEEYNDLSWYDEYKEKDDKEKAWIITRKKYNFYPNIISLVSPVYLNHETRLGAIIINIDVDELRKYIKSDNNSIENILIIDDSKRLLFSYSNNFFLTNINDISKYNKIPITEKDYSIILDLDEEKYAVSTTNSKIQSWKYISAVPMNNYRYKIQEVLNYIWLLFIFVIIIAFISSFIITIKTYNPVKKIISIIDEPESWNILPEHKLNVKSNEMKYITENIVKTIYFNKELRNELEYKLNSLNKAQTLALEAQINPHFLYNTLETIRWLVVELTNGENKASHMIESLSKLLRFILDSTEKLITIEEEIKYTKLYLEIMKMRYEEKLSIEWDIPKEMYEYKIVKLTFQPLIENAIYHGIKPSNRNGIISISGRIKESEMLIEIRDNGVGINEDELLLINREIDENDVLKGGHIGINNVNYRIKLILGKGYGVKVHSRKDEGTVVRIRLPKLIDNIF